MQKLFERVGNDKSHCAYLISQVGRACGIIPISQILKRFGISKYDSVGSVSQILKFAGNLLSNTLVNEDSDVKLVIIASDEIFSHLNPILVTVDPVSSAILRIELADSRKIEIWKNHWECMDESGYIAKGRSRNLS